ncbi:hypothetical protein OC845_000173 [Tilletia horrida]|nr:hypothetical protein OC845_000173 [Tilletia horrida]
MSSFSDEDNFEDTMDEDSGPSEFDFEGNEDSEVEDDFFDDAGFESNADDVFGSQDISRPRKKPYQVDFKCHSADSIVAAQRKEIERIATTFDMKDTDAATLLRHFGWNSERLIEKYMEQPEAVQVDAGIHEDPRHTKLIALEDFMCDICCMSGEDHPSGKIQTVALTCDHRFCKDCYKQYIERKVQEEGESRRVQCMQEKCSIIVDERTVGLVVSPEIFERYKLLLNRTFVDDSNTMRWCPAPNCELAVECHVPAKRLKAIVPTVQCDCGHSFCFGCGQAAHAPCICAIVKLWLKKCEDDSETAHWINANTKECPKCYSTIEKNGGCNHMTCRKCRYDFCWICSGPWSEHGTSWYNCNRFDERSGSDARDQQAKSRESLERYLHYFNRFANHEHSAKLERDLYTKTEKKMEEMQQTSALTWIEAQFLRKAVDTLTECRMTLKWTYAMAYYLEKNNMTILFEDNQRDLERAVEELSENVEKPIDVSAIPQLRQKVTDLTAYVQKRREIVLTDTAEGFSENRWKWNVPI